jgi:hypothetical protein
MKSGNGMQNNSYADIFLQDKPGSSSAIQRGCTCPAAENNFGRGRSKNGVIEAAFTTDPNCSLHGLEVLTKMLREQGQID